MTNDPQAEEVRKSFETELNLHGYGFQFSLLQRAQDLAGNGSRWRFSVAEFPVGVQGSGTRIDFVLVRRLESAVKFMICECKRANPSLSNWCFIRTRYTHRNQRGKTAPLIFESAILSEDQSLRVFANLESYAPEVFHVALPIAATAKGDSKPVGQFRSQIEEAATQVMRGLNGFIEMLSTNPQLLNPTGRQDAVARFLPTIFTTASLWVSDADLATADITTGKIDLSQGQFKKVPWLWYQYNVSPGIKHSRQALEKKRKLEEVMQEEHIRTIAVVNPSGLPEFLEHTSDFY